MQTNGNASSKKTSGEMPEQQGIKIARFPGLPRSTGLTSPERQVNFCKAVFAELIKQCSHQVQMQFTLHSSSTMQATPLIGQYVAGCCSAVASHQDGCHMLHASCQKPSSFEFCLIRHTRHSVEKGIQAPS